MPFRQSLPLLSSPVRVFAVMLLLVFAAEGLIMLGLPLLPGRWHGTAREGFLDAALLTAVSAPAVWFLLVLPLRRSLEARGNLMRRLFDVREQEASRVARDLHDGVGQNLTAVLVGLRRVVEAGDLETARGRARDLEAIASRAHAEVRDLARGLHPALLDEHGLVVAIERLCETFERSHGIPVRFHPPAADAGRPAGEVEVGLYRIAQEALANVARHAGAQRVDVWLERRGPWIRLAVQDDGVGMPAGGPRADGLGLGSIRERAWMLGGSCQVRSGRGQGTCVEVRVPGEA